MDLRKDDQGRGIPMKKMTSHFKDTLNPHDVVDDAIHNFSRVYQKYAQQDNIMSGESSGDEGEKTSTYQGTAGTNSDDDRSGSKSYSSPSNKLSKFIPSKKSHEELERVTLLVQSDEDEI